MPNFWKKLKKPVLALAPMAGFTDSAFRQICAHFGAQVTYSEMASATALNYQPIKTLQLLQATKTEFPYVIQLFGSQPKHFVEAVKLVQSKKLALKYVDNWLTPAGIDINFGCPVPKVLSQKAGAALLDDLKLARRIIEAVVNNTNLPVSIKVRSAGREVSVLKFLDFIADLGVKAVMIHGRSLKQGFSGSADWQIIKQARQYFDGLILANGGVFTSADGLNLLKQTKADGLGIARGALGQPWIFTAIKTALETKAKKFLKLDNKRLAFSNLAVQTAIAQAHLANKLKGELGIVQLRKHLCYYARGMVGAKKLRPKLVQVKNVKEIEIIFQQFKEQTIKGQTSNITSNITNNINTNNINTNNKKAFLFAP